MTRLGMNKYSNIWKFWLKMYRFSNIFTIFL